MEKRSFYAPDIDISTLGQSLQDWFTQQQYETQIPPSQAGGITVQARKESTLRKVIGKANALTVVINLDGEYITIEMGGAKWAEKGAVGAVGLLIFCPALITAGIGAFQQSQVQTQAWQFIEGFLKSNSAYGGSMMGAGSPFGPAPSPSVFPGQPPLASLRQHDPASPPPPVNLGQAPAAEQGEAVDAKCPQCNQPLRPGSKFCNSCGNPIPSSAAYCLGCGRPLLAGARFCDACGTPVS